MARKSQKSVGGSAASAYRDDPDAVSLHTTPDDYEYSDAPPAGEDLPSYAESSTTGSSFPSNTGNAESPTHPERRQETSYSDAERAATVDRLVDAYSVHQRGGTNGWRVHRNGKPAECNKTTIRIDERLTDAEELHRYIIDYLARVPPHPCVRIHGNHKEHRRDKDGKSTTEQATDFDITLDLQRFLRPAGDSRFWGARVIDSCDRVHRGSWRKTRAPGYKQDIEVGNDEDAEAAAGKLTLRQWCEEYCANPSWLKIFRINRNVLGLSESFLRSEIDKVVRETDYLGRIDISFPIEETHVDIYSPHWINRARISWVRWLFYLTFLWLLTWPVLFFVTRRWDVFNVNWLWSYLDQDAGVENEERTMITYPRRYATISESDWFERHRALIRRMVLMKHQGDATNMAPHIENEPSRPVGMGLPSTGNAALDSAAGLMHAGLSTWSAVSRGRVPTQGWGGDC